MRFEDCRPDLVIVNAVHGTRDVIKKVVPRGSFSIVITKKGRKIFNTDTGDPYTSLGYWDGEIPELILDERMDK